ncbi:hypothetical protein QNH36_15670 [Mesobacillus sp. AQ2]|nr:MULTISPECIES: hypothetical protein [Bacillaceae]WHX39113.1 hypothetical protein QNH36_15670 [Mesobacillus sp. AQ2]
MRAINAQANSFIFNLNRITSGPVLFWINRVTLNENRLTFLAER